MKAYVVSFWQGDPNQDGIEVETVGIEAWDVWDLLENLRTSMIRNLARYPRFEEYTTLVIEEIGRKASNDNRV